jgi:lysozyme
MARSDAAIVKDWEDRLHTRRVLLANARRQAAYWRSEKAKAKKGTSRYSHCGAMLADRDQKVSERKEQVAYAERVIARHKPKAPAASGGMSSAGVLLVARFEGFRSRPYRDAVGVWTIGYGETRGVGPNTRPVSQSQAFAALKRRLDQDYLAPALRYCHAVGFHPTQHQADALGSLSYNLGPGIFARGKTMGNAIASHDRMAIANAFLVYDKAGSPPRALAGLTSRRRAERALFLS